MTAFLTIQCKACGAIYRAYRQLDPLQAQINYCMFCGQTNPNISQDSNQDVIDVLAGHYNKPPDVIALLLKYYNQQHDMTFEQLVTGK